MAKPRFRLSGEGHEVAVAYWCTLLGATTHDQNTDIATFTVIRQSLFDDFAAIGNGHMFLNICFSVTNVLLLLFSIVVCRESMPGVDKVVSPLAIFWYGFLLR